MFGSLQSNNIGDSGAGFYVEKGNTRYYLGAVGGAQAGITNCNGSFTRFAPNGGMSGITPTYKFLALIKEAEDFVANEKRLEAMQQQKQSDMEMQTQSNVDSANAAAQSKAELAKIEADAKISINSSLIESEIRKMYEEAEKKKELMDKLIGDADNQLN